MTTVNVGATTVLETVFLVDWLTDADDDVTDDAGFVGVVIPEVVMPGEMTVTAG